MSSITYTDHRHGVIVDVNDLQIDLDVQRATVASRLRKLVANYNPDYLGELLVSERPEGLYVLDGHHRLETTKRVNGQAPTQLACEVFKGLSRADEAMLFMHRNDRANVSTTDKNRNLHTAGDPAVLDIHMAAQAAGFVFIAADKEKTTFRDLAAGVAIMNAAEKSKREITGPEHLTEVFEFYARAYGNQEVVESLLLKVFGKIFLKYEIDEDRLYGRVRGIPPQQLVHQAHVRKEDLSAIKGVSPVTAGVEVIAELYNSGLPADSSKRIRL